MEQRKITSIIVASRDRCSRGRRAPARPVAARSSSEHGRSTSTERARRVRLLLFDVDGVLTDGKILLHADGTRVQDVRHPRRHGDRPRPAGRPARRACCRRGSRRRRPSGPPSFAFRSSVRARSTSSRRWTRSSPAEGLTDDDVAFMGDDLLDLPVLGRVGLARRPADAAAGGPRAARTGSAARAGRRRRRPRAGRDGAQGAGTLGRAGRRVDSRRRAGHDRLSHARRAGGAAGRPGHRQGLGAVQAARRPVDRSPQGARVSALHRRARPGGRATRSIRRSTSCRAPRGSTKTRSRSTSCSATCIARRARSAAPSTSTRDCCSGRGSRRWSTRTSCSAWASTSGAAASSIARTKRSRKCCGSTRRTGTRWCSSRSCTKSSTSGPRPTKSGSSSPKSTASRLAAARPGNPRLSRKRAGRRGVAPGRSRRGPRERFRAAIERDKNGRAGLPAIWATSRAGRRLRPAPSTRGSAIVEIAPERAYLAFDRLQDACAAARHAAAVRRACRRLIAANSQDWRARLALARHRVAAGDAAGALELLFEALSHNPHALVIHQEIWKALSALGRSAAAGRALSRR